MVTVLFADEGDGFEDVGVFGAGQFSTYFKHEGFDSIIVGIVDVKLVIDGALVDFIEQTFGDELS